MSASSDTPTRPSSNARRLLGGLAVAFALAGAGLLYGASQPWQQVTISRGEPLPDMLKVLYGGTLVPMLTALGVLSLAAVVGLLATRTLGRRLVAVVVFACAVVTAYLVVQALTASQDERAAAAENVAESITPHGAPEVSQLAVVAGCAGVVIAAVAAILLFVAAPRIPQMGSRYERESGAATKKRGGDPETEERERWKALDRGEDPTA